MSTADENAATEPYVCEHCDDSVPHQHVDEQPLVEAYRRALLRAGLLAAGAALIWLAAAIILAWDSSYGLLLGSLAWAVATAIGLVVFLVVQRSAGGATAVIAGAIGTAAITPILALVVAFLVPGPMWARGLTSGLGWLVLSLLVTGIRTGRLRDTLTAHTRPGEAARSAVVRTGGRPSPYVESAWLVATAVVFGLCVVATALMPILTGVLVPLNAALAMASRRMQARASAPTSPPNS